MELVEHKGSSWLRIGLAALLAVAFFGAVGYGIFLGLDVFLASAGPWIWASLFGLIFVSVAYDIIAHRNSHEVTMKSAGLWYGFWVSVAVGYGLFISSVGKLPFSETFSLYITGWALESTLALDNLFVMAMIFKSFGLMKKEHQPIQLKILYYGIVGMVLMRVLFLSFGALFVNLPSIEVFGLHIEWPMLIFAAIIAYAVVKMSGDDSDEDVDYTNHWSVKATSWVFPVNPIVANGKFFIAGAVTIPFLCMIVIEMVDFMFAFDSMPVIIAVVKDPFIMAASNLMACCGLRSLYFVLIAARSKLWALDTAVKYLLIFIALKLLLAGFGFHIPALISLAIVAAFIVGGILVSFYVKNPHPEAEAKHDNEVVA